jgi:Fe-S cluster assembly iron-binding protein IscA
MSIISPAGDPWPNNWQQPSQNFSWSVRTTGPSGDVIWTTGTGTSTGSLGGVIPVTYPQPPNPLSYPQPCFPQTSQFPVFQPLTPAQSDKERTERLCEIVASQKVYIRKAVENNGCNMMSVNIEVNDIPPPVSDFAPWEKSLVLFNSSFGGNNVSLAETDTLVKTFAAMLTATGSRVIIDGQEFDPQ